MRAPSQTRGAVNTRAYRSASPAYAERERRRTTARQSALEALARKHPGEFSALYEDELDSAGVGDPEMVRACACGAEIERRSSVGRWPKRCGACQTEVQRQRNERRTKATAA